MLKPKKTSFTWHLGYHKHNIAAIKHQKLKDKLSSKHSLVSQGLLCKTFYMNLSFKKYISDLYSEKEIRFESFNT